MSYFKTKLAVFILVCGIVFSQSDNSDKIYFPGQIDRDDNKISTSLRIAQRINSMTSYEEFLTFINLPPEKKILIADRIGSSEEKSNAERPTPAGCKPENQTISLKPKNHFSKIYFPPCMRIGRCSGCCSHYLLSCQPIETEIRNIEVFVADFNGNSDIIFNNKEIIPVEEHKKCRCDCKIKPEHCNQKQAYKYNECRCVCTNVDEEEKCNAKKEIKIWDSETCTCACKETEMCSSGLYFDNNTCRCEMKK